MDWVSTIKRFTIARPMPFPRKPGRTYIRWISPIPFSSFFRQPTINLTEILERLMRSLFLPAFLFNRPLTSFARRTQTDADILPPRPAEAKTSIASRYHYRFCLYGMMLLTGLVAQSKIIYRLRIVCVCLRLNKFLFKASNGYQRLIHSTNLEMIHFGSFKIVCSVPESKFYRYKKNLGLALLS